jgi:hypothetical protein
MNRMCKALDRLLSIYPMTLETLLTTPVESSARVGKAETPHYPTCDPLIPSGEPVRTHIG